MVDHKILLNKLYKCGFRGFCLKWFSSYLSGRSQTVKIAASLGENRALKVGVPQGSVLGPVLFLVYVNSIFSISLKGSPTAFADDLACYYSETSLIDLFSSINHDVELLRYWFGSHKLIVSKKTTNIY